MKTHNITRNLTGPASPGPELSALVRGMLTIRGTSLRAVCLEHGWSVATTRAALVGRFQGPDSARAIHAICERAGVPAPATVPDVRGWLSSREFASLAGIRPNSAARVLLWAFNGKPWRGTHLRVVRLPGGRFASPYTYQLDPESLPQALRDKHAASQGQGGGDVSAPELATSPRD